MASNSSDAATVIGADATFKGELSFKGSIRVEGTFEGSIETPGKVHVNQGGKLKAEVKVGSLVLDGTLEGNVQASERLELNSTGRLVGDIKAEKLVVKEGASFVGRCEVGPGAPGAPRSAADAAMRQVTAAAQGRK